LDPVVFCVEMAQPPFRRTREEVRKAVKDVIKAFNFKDPARTKEDATQCLMAYPFLRPHPGEVRLPDGSLAKSLKLSGTVGMKYKTKEYFVPCAFFLTEDYPKRGPLCYVCPTPNMLIKTNHQHVDQHGLCYLPYLHEWNKKTSHLCGSIGALAGVFEKDPFIYSKPSVPAAQPAQSSGVAAGRPAYTPQQQVAQPAKPAEPRQPGDADLGGLREQLEDLQSKCVVQLWFPFLFLFSLLCSNLASGWKIRNLALCASLIERMPSLSLADTSLAA